MIEDVRRLLGPRFEQVAGARAAGEIPLSEVLVNQLVAEGLRRSPDGAIEAADVNVHAGGELEVRLRFRRPRFVPPITVRLRIETQPMPDAPQLVLRWDLPAMGALAAFATPVLSFLNLARPGMTVHGDRITIDVPRLVRDQGGGELLDYLTSLRVETRPRALVIAFELRVPDPAGRISP